MDWRNREGNRQDEAKIRKDGETRGVKGFALFPMDIDGDTIWLEKFYDIQQWSATWKCWIAIGKSRVWE